jgi:hypothetical protein
MNRVRRLDPGFLINQAASDRRAIDQSMTVPQFMLRYNNTCGWCNNRQGQSYGSYASTHNFRSCEVVKREQTTHCLGDLDHTSQHRDRCLVLW